MLLTFLRLSLGQLCNIDDTWAVGAPQPSRGLAPAPAGTCCNTVMTLHCTLRGVPHNRRHWKGQGRHINLAAVWIPGRHCISFNVCRWVTHKHSGIAPAAGASSASVDVRMQQCGQLGSTPGYDCTNSAFMQVLQVSADNCFSGSMYQPSKAKGQYH